MSELTLRIASMSAEAKDVLRLELVDAAGGELPPFEPGAHVTLRLPNGLPRQYSLVNDARERHRYVLGIGRAAAGRGGSAFVHDALRPGMDIACDAPANNFRLDPGAPRFMFIAGGIGITPILAMARRCEADGRPWQLVYAARSRVRLAFYEELATYGARVAFHCDDERGRPLDVAALMRDASPGTHVYCCGPAPLMNAVQAAGGHLGPDALHFEWFNPPAADPVAAQPGAAGFWIDLQRSGTSLHVPPDRSILEVLEANGHDVPYSCREGLCGTCETPLCGGEPDHRDYVYPPAQRAGLRSMLVCVSRAKSGRLLLDL